jgi:hypothetical protein
MFTEEQQGMLEALNRQHFDTFKSFFKDAISKDGCSYHVNVIFALFLSLQHFQFLLHDNCLLAQGLYLT